MQKAIFIKRLLQVVWAVVVLGFLLMTLPLFGIAAGKTINIKDLCIRCTIPDNFTYVFTRDNINATDASSLGLTKSDVLNMLKESDIYLEAGTDNFETDFRITMVPITIGDFSDYGDTLLNGLASEMATSLKVYGHSKITWEIYHHTDTVFLKFEYSLPSGSGYSDSIQYYTVMNAQAINFTCSFQSKPTSSDRTMVKRIVDSATFENAQKKESEAAIKKAHPAIDFSDDYVTFIIPAGWQKEEAIPTHTLINSKYSRAGHADVLFMYGTTDLWEQLSASEKNKLSRKDFSNSLLTTKEAKELFIGEELGVGNAVESVFSTSVNGRDYYQIIYTTHNNDFGIPVSIKNTMMVHIEDGYGSIFVLTQDPSGSFFSEFIELLGSIEYHYPAGESGHESNSDSKKSETANPSCNTDNEKNNSSAKYLLLLLLVIPIAFICYYVVRKKKSTQASIQRDNIELPKTGTIMQAEERPTAIFFCHKCGSRLAEGDVVCRHCGTTIPSR